ncbi:Ubiquitin carboxyl-terminal hydrolase MINDY-1 [Chytridiales sp. JEL 0842]|nr:Ubiquitin carboxyl-terminal hydrolase MINDY-1 [Chytridiales sp. JEL 0842]
MDAANAPAPSTMAAPAPGSQVPPPAIKEPSSSVNLENEAASRLANMSLSDPSSAEPPAATSPSPAPASTSAPLQPPAVSSSSSPPPAPPKPPSTLSPPPQPVSYAAAAGGSTNGATANTSTSRPPSAHHQPSSSPCTEYTLKPITWKDPRHSPTDPPRKLKIIAQNENGPCPLLALCNVLLLRGDIEISYDRPTVTYEHLVALVGDVLLARTNLHQPSSPNISTPSQAEALANLSQNLQDVMNLIPTLQTGLDVNVRFDSPFAFELTPALLIFDLFGITLAHGWTVDPQDEETYKVVVESVGSYNKVVEAVIGIEDASNELAALEKKMSVSAEQTDDQQLQTLALERAKREKAIHEGLVCQSFLNTTASQLTYHGLNSLVESLPPHSLSVFFRNNHFSTLYKHHEKGLFTLVTDQGFVNAHGAVWETLSNVEGDSEFVDGTLKEYRPTNEELEAENAAKQMGVVDIDNINKEEQERAWAIATGAIPPPEATNQGHHHQAQAGGSTYDDDLALALRLQDEENAASQHEDPPGHYPGQPQHQQHQNAPQSYDAVLASHHQRREQGQRPATQQGGRPNQQQQQQKPSSGDKKKDKGECVVM